MKACSEDGYGAAVLIVSRMDDQLKIRAQMHALCDSEIVVDFDNVFIARPKELAISNQDAKAAGREVPQPGPRSLIGNECETDVIIGPPPILTGDGEPAR